MSTHEQFIDRVFALASKSPDLTTGDHAALSGIKLVYGAGQAGLRGVTYFSRWKGGQEPKPFVEVCAFGQESWVQVAGTTLHELGHVIAGWNAGHGPDWKAACKRLGLRGIRAAGTCYHKACFAPALRYEIERLDKPNDGEPVPGLSYGGAAISVKPCGAGFGTRGGKSRGKGSGSRLRLWQCACEPAVKVRVARDTFEAHCDVCSQPFERISKPGRATKFFNKHGFWPEHNPEAAAALGWKQD